MEMSLRRVAGIAATCLGIAASAWAQEKQRASFVLPAGNSKYTQQHVLEVGDVPEHKLRLYELQRTFPADGPVFEGTRLVELWIRGINDFVDTNGPAIAYSVYVFENGDKVFARSDLVAVTDAGKSTTLAAGRITGGTGKFRGMKGIIRVASAPDPRSGLMRSTFDIDYWFDK
jgi:hypothetical protein